jgi:hypothetical protein
MDYSKLSSAGGKATAKKLRDNALTNYYENPNFCKNCEGVIEVGEKEKVGNVRKKTFCSSSCSATFNNKGVRRTKKSEKSKLKDPINSFNISELTKSELFNRYKNYQTARSMICKNARKVFFNSGRERRCFECGYDIKIDIAHIKSVSSFSSDSKISEINHIDNLLPLCPNHHGEFDIDYLKINIAG